MTSSTQFRVATLDPRPLLSPVISAHVAVKVTFKVRSPGVGVSSGCMGQSRLPRSAFDVAFQVLKPVRPGRSERETAFGTQFSAKIKRATH